MQNLTGLLSEKDKEKIYSIFPELKDDFILSPKLKHDVATEFISKELSSFPDYLRVVIPQAGGRYVTGGLKYFDGNESRKKAIDESCCDYLAMFILSIGVRYKQDFWGEIISGKSSGVLSIIEIYINTIKRRFPNKILDAIFNERFVYGISGYLT